MAWKVVFYRDLVTHEQPAREWLVELRKSEPEKYAAALAAIKRVLAAHGIDVCETEWGKNLGSGLYEFRIRHPAGTIETMFPLADDDATATTEGRGAARLLLRIYFTTYGPHVILICSGYDKGRDPSSHRQRAEITRARELAEKARDGLRARLRDTGA